MESRKRSRTEEADTTRAKKRAINDGGNSPRSVNGAASDPDEPKDDANLEMYRKDAIYRRMKHYSRENERSLTRIAELERRRDRCEAGLAALEACWTQLIDTVRSLVSSDDLATISLDAQDIYDITSNISTNSDPDYVQTLCDKFQVTQQLVTSLVQLGRTARNPLSKDEASSERTQIQCATLRSEVSVIRNRLKDAESEKEGLYEQLVVAQKRVDRLQSKTLAVLQPHPSSPRVEENVKDETPRGSPSSPVPPQPVTNGVHTDVTDDAEKEILQLRNSKIDELEKENRILRGEIITLKYQLEFIPEPVVVSSPYYKVVLDYASKLEHDIKELQLECTKAKEGLDEHLCFRDAWEKAYTKESEECISDLRKQLARRDTEIARLREQRDQQSSELHERKQRDHVKLASLNELKALAETRLERIKALQSEVSRIQSRLAAQESNEDLLTFLLRDRSEDVSYVDDMKRRLVAAEDRVAALETSLSVFQEDHPDVIHHMRSEAEARQQLADLTRRLQKYESIFGLEASPDSPDVQVLSQQLRQKQDEISRLRLLEQQRAQTESSLYAELDKLSAAWETLDRQVKSKVFDLSSMEERLSKAGMERAKSENKFYSAMRDKEALENERKNLIRNVEKQNKAVEKLVESEKNLSERVSIFEKEQMLQRRTLDELKTTNKLLSQDLGKATASVDAEKQTYAKDYNRLMEKEKEVDARQVEARKHADSLLRAKKEVEKQAAKLKAAAQAHSGSASSREAQLQSELEKCMTLLQCSTCKMNMRNTVITKCMHSFCKQCVDNRIASRQRKCPACGLAFSQGEVQQLYFQ